MFLQLLSSLVFQNYKSMDSERVFIQFTLSRMGQKTQLAMSYISCLAFVLKDDLSTKSPAALKWLKESCDSILWSVGGKVLS